MAWIESHQDLRTNAKTRRAARRLGVTIPAVMGHLHCLWHWALDHAFDGDLSGFDAEDLADAAAWDGDPDDLVKALVDCGPGDRAGFLEHDGVTADGRPAALVLHDWGEFTAYLRARRNRASSAAHTRWHANRGLPDPGCVWCQDDAQALPEHDETDARAMPEHSPSNARTEPSNAPTEPTDEVKPRARTRARKPTPPVDNGRSPPDPVAALSRIVGRHSTSQPRPDALDADPALAAAVDEIGWHNIGRMNLASSADRRKLQAAYDRARKAHR